MNACNHGVNIGEAIDKAIEIGDCKLNEFNPNNCILLPTYKEAEKAKDIKILTKVPVLDGNDSKEIKISKVIKSIDALKPVIIGLKLRTSFDYVSSNGLYAPKINEKYLDRKDPSGTDNASEAGHALCIIGYDNENKRFEVMNSWDTTWGNKGFFYLSYDDFIKDVDEAYKIIISKNIYNRKIQGDFNLLKYTQTNNKGENIFKSLNPYFGADYSYYLNSELKKDDFFRMKVQNLVKDSYVYVFSYKPNKTFEILFPLHYSDPKYNDLAFIPNNNVSFELPIDKQNGYTADMRGDDIMVILYSLKPLDDLSQKLQTIKYFNGDIWKWLEKNYKEELVNKDDINYSTFSMGFNSNVKSGSLIPLILKAKIL
jgi:hypothetical protein